MVTVDLTGPSPQFELTTLVCAVQAWKTLKISSKTKLEYPQPRGSVDKSAKKP